MSISFFNDLGGFFPHFSWLLLLGLHSRSSEVECTPKMSISFFDDLGGILSHFSWLSLLGWSSEFECNPKTSISFFGDLGGLFHISVDFHHSDDSANHHCPSQMSCTAKRWRRDWTELSLGWNLLNVNLKNLNFLATLFPTFPSRGGGGCTEDPDWNNRRP